MGVKRQLHDVDIDTAINKFDLYERKIDDMEGEIEAYDLGQRNLADEIADLESNEKVDEELEKLKARLSRGPDTPPVRDIRPDAESGSDSTV
jgi:phage shock protein A